jgi:hypothetical protein
MQEHILTKNPAVTPRPIYSYVDQRCCSLTWTVGFEVRCSHKGRLAA